MKELIISIIFLPLETRVKTMKPTKKGNCCNQNSRQHINAVYDGLRLFRSHSSTGAIEVAEATAIPPLIETESSTSKKPGK